MRKNKTKNIQEKIMSWYESNGRHDLPWRHTHDIYHIAVAEIMLQQTNVPKVVDKYTSFLKKFPTLATLAHAPQKTVLMQWSGLGYNRRAIYLHRMAQDIVNKYDGIFPNNVEELIKLHGIGPYTSKSILIFACNQDMVTSDVNIDRIMKRIHNKPAATNEQVITWAQRLLLHMRSRDWHNALMDFASIVCTKRSPQCNICPIRNECSSFPQPEDIPIQKRQEIGWTENGKHVPRRIFRGRMIDHLRKHSIGTVEEIGRNIKKDWCYEKDHKWCEDVLKGLMKDQLVTCENDEWMLQ